MTYFNANTFLIRINKDYAIAPKEIKDKTILFGENAKKILEDLA